MLRDWRQIFPRLEIRTLIIVMIACRTASRALVVAIGLAIRSVFLRRTIFDKVFALQRKE